MASKRKLSPAEQVDTAVIAARVTLETKGAVTGAQLGPAAIRPQVVQRLCAEGYEPTTKGLRRALDEQGRKLLEAGEPVSLTDVKKRLTGVTPAETKELVAQLCLTGRAHLVLRGTQQYLTPRGAPVLDRNALKAVTEKLKTTAAWIEKARKDKAGVTVLEADLDAELSALKGAYSSVGKNANLAASNGSSKDAPSAQVKRADAGERGPIAVALRGAILALRDEDSHLASVPEVSRWLRELISSQQVIDALLSEFEGGRVELRPEGGIGRLREEDRALCPVGAGGLPLSWVALLED